MNKISEVKLLLTMFNQREVSFITGMTTSKISRIANNLIKKYESAPIARQLSYFRPAVEVINKLKEVRGIAGKSSLINADIQYMKILKLTGAALEDVKSCYADRSSAEIREAWNHCQKVNLSTFNFSLLGLENSDVQILKTLLKVNL